MPTRRLTGTVSLLVLATLAGCASSHVQFTRAEIRLREEPDRQPGVRFDAGVVTRGMAGRQLVYRVTLEDRTGNPIQSTDGRFQMPSGQVACARTFFVHYPIQANDLTSVIPMGQLEARSDQLPVIARFGIYLPTGKSLAVTKRTVPPEFVTRGARSFHEWTTMRTNSDGHRHEGGLPHNASGY